MNNRIILLAITLIAIVSISSCSKDKEVVRDTTEFNNLDKQLIQNKDDILMFSDQDDFAKHIVLINQMNSSELMDFQMNNNYTSYGLFCDDLYSYISKDSLNSDLVIQNTENNSNYLQIIFNIIIGAVCFMQLHFLNQ